MNKRIIIGIVVLMGFSLVGIILVQIFWIKNAIEVKEAQLDRTINDALTSVVEQLDKDKNVRFISRNLRTSNDTLEEYCISFTDSIITHDIVWNGDESVINLDQDKNGTFIINPDENGIITIEELDDDNVRIKTIEKLDSLRKKIHTEKYLVMSKIEDSVNVIIRSKFSEVNQMNEELEDVINEMVIEIEDIAEQENIKLTDMEFGKRIEESLRDKEITLPFEYAIYNPQEDSLLLMSDRFQRADIDDSYKTRLYPRKIIEKPDLMLLNFPDKNIYLFRSLALLLSGSALFTLVILLTFFLTIRIILNQKRLAEIKTDFINNMTHEFKTPIATISLAVDSINNDKVIGQPEKIRYFTGIIDEENKRMNSQVESVLQMSLIDKKDFDFHFEDVDVHSIIQRVANSFELQAKSKNGIIQMKLGATNHRLNIDKVHFSNMLSNLLDNAIKYSDKPPEVTISTKQLNDGIVISVSDNGVGMTKAEQERIFDKFYRVPKGDIHNVKGFGLGLSYVKAVVLTMGGRIEVDSQAGKGSIFQLVLPLNAFPK
ncbi:MAG: HAMP domain-containing sensor histidine kinase [Bacteroidales bacterium]